MSKLKPHAKEYILKKIRIGRLPSITAVKQEIRAIKLASSIRRQKKEITS